LNKDIIINSIDILFRKLNAQQIISNTFEVFINKKLQNKYMFNNISKEQFINQGFAIFKERSEDEIENIFIYINSILNMETGVFELLAELSKEFLYIDGNKIECNKANLLDWRMMYSRVGQDILTTLNFAINDIHHKSERIDFDWKPIIDVKGIENNKEVAENHFHLKGSAPIFALTWISLMNDITGRSKQFNKAKIDIKRLDPDFNISLIKKNTSLNILLKKAAIIRIFLFSWINNRSFFLNEKKWNEQNEWLELSKYMQDNMLLDIKSYAIQEKINRVKYIFGKRYDEIRIVDYAIKIDNDKQILLEEEIHTNDILTGERYFLYMMHKKIYDMDKDEKTNPYINLFYAYITIKSKFRSELVQVNKRVGFKNFADYQDRKSCFINHDKLLMSLMYNTAINQTIENQLKIKYLEARIAPENSKSKLSKTISQIDNDVKKYKYKHNSKLENLKLIKQNNVNIDLNKYFYVVHFIKCKDKTKSKSEVNKFAFNFLPRDYEKRAEVKKQAVVIESLKEQYYYMKKGFDLLKLNGNIYHSSKRILGIDACANEIGCRPEVFAQAFRYLRKKKNKFPISNKIILGATYHVGEDFLDIADGLRAIDEAIKYLCLGKYDRLGHALALGIDVDEWYVCKNRTIILSKQDLLDNISWLLIKIEELMVCTKQNIGIKEYDLNNLKKSFVELLKDIYGDSLIYNGKQFTKFSVKDYYSSWLLRGNDPYLYLKANRNNNISGSWSSYGIIEELLVNEDKLKSECLFYNYHFNNEIKAKGKIMTIYSISSDYEECVKIVQKDMLLKIQANGISIETNPSSNYLIGTIKRYDEHPISKFYDIEDANKECMVSINTDDQGIFSTNLTNEYAIMQVALEIKHEPEDVQIWIDNIKKASLRQSFAESVTLD